MDLLDSLLAASGVPYEITRSPRCHKIRIAGHLVQTLPVAVASTNHRADANAVIRDTSQSSFAGAHSDIRHPEVAELIVAAATAGAAAQRAQAGAQTAGSQGAGSQAAGTQAR